MSFYSKSLHLPRLLLGKGAQFGLKLLGAITFMALPVQAMSDAHQKGISLAQSIPLPQPGNPENVLGYAGTDLPQSQIKAHDMGEEALKASQASEASQVISESFEKGEKFVIDPRTDPLIVAGNEIIANPQKALDERFVEGEEAEPVTEEVNTCEESGEDTLEACEECRVVEVKDCKHRSQVYIYSHGWSGGLSRNVITGEKLDGSTQSTGAYAACTVIHNPLPKNLQNRVKKIEFAQDFTCPFYISLLDNGVLSVATGSGGGWRHINGLYANIDISCVPGEEEVAESIKNNCPYLEEKVEKGLCSYEDIIVMEGPQTRIINGYAVTRDWWRRKKIYRCHYPAKNDCGALRAKGCYQVNSACREKIEDVCVVWEQTYRCPSNNIRGKTYRSSNKENPFCLSGDCTNKSYAPNRDFAQVMSHMSVLKEAGDDLRNFGSIFKGLDWRCTRHCIGFKDCCGNGKGWGVSLKLASCDEKERTLAELRAQNRCIQVGTYCSEKKLGVCIRKKTTFCCYDTKLAKIVQEQGKRQLRLGFGDPEHPQCQGLTIEQLAQLDFSKIDFSDMLADIVLSTKTPTPDKLMSGIQNSMKDRGALLKIKDKAGPQSMVLPHTSEEPTKALPEVLKNSSAPLPPHLPPKVVNKQVGAHTLPTTKSPQDHQIQGRSHGQF